MKAMITQILEGLHRFIQGRHLCGALFIIFLYVTLFVCSSWGITSSGKIKFNEIWSGKIHLTGDVLIPKYVTLTIEKGTHITFSSGASDNDFNVIRKVSGKELNLAFDGKVAIIIKGNLIAKGGKEETNEIVIGNDDEGIHWGSLIFIGRNENSVLRSVTLQGAAVGAIFADNSVCRINKTNLQNNGLGIMCLDNSSPIFVENDIQNNITCGMDVLGNSSPIIKFNDINGNRASGINVKGTSKPRIKGNNIENNQVGIAVYDSSHPQIEKNNLRFNKQKFLGLVSPVIWQKKSTYGKIKKDEIWEGKIVITGDVVVPIGVTLTVLPGTHISFSINQSEYDATVLREISNKKRNVAFSDKCDIIVYGTLKIKGQMHKMVKIGNPDPPQADWGDKIAWGSIIFLGHNADSYINYTEIRYASIGLFLWDDATPQITNCKINNNEFGIVCVDMSSPLIGNNLISSNKFGIGVYDFASPSIVKNIIREEGVLGIGSKDVSIPKLLENKILSNEVGIGVYDSASPTIDGNFISNNRLGLLSLNSSKPSITNNIIHKNRDVGIRIKDSSNPTIDKNQFKENTDGIEYWVTAKPQFGTNIFQGNKKRIVTKTGRRKVTTSGTLRTNETWSGNIYLTGDIVVPKGIVLEILPNTVITFSPNLSDYDFAEIKSMGDKQVNVAFNNRCDIVVKGSFLAKGLEDKNILIGNPELRGYVKDKVGWGSIILLGNNRSSKFENVVVRHASLGISLWDSSSPSIKNTRIERSTVGIDCFMHSSPSIVHCTVVENRFGIINEGSSSAKINRSIISKNYIGVSCKDKTNCKFEHNLISKNKYGIDISNKSNPLIMENTVSGGGVGIACSDLSSPRIGNNKINENRTGIMIEDDSLPKINDNFFKSNWQKIIDLRQ